MDDHVKLCEELFSAAQDRVQAPRVLLLPQLRVRLRVEGQPPPRTPSARRTWRPHAQVRARLQAGLRRRRDDEPLRDPAAGRLDRVLRTTRPGAVWMKRMLDVYPRAVWLNPEPEELWRYRQSIAILARDHGRTHVPDHASRDSSARCALCRSKPSKTQSRKGSRRKRPCTRSFAGVASLRRWGGSYSAQATRPEGDDVSVRSHRRSNSPAVPASASTVARVLLATACSSGARARRPSSTPSAMASMRRLRAMSMQRLHDDPVVWACTSERVTAARRGRHPRAIARDLCRGELAFERRETRRWLPRNNQAAACPGGGATFSTSSSVVTPGATFIAPLMRSGFMPSL